ncbi:MAG: oligoendopeptidase F [Spirochaetaceae bacterium]|nr:oligoendopeptidase F [Spirochaetaceae bacterium]
MKNAIAKRSEVPSGDKWNLSSLFPSEEAWEKDFSKQEAGISHAGDMKDILGKSPEGFLKVLAAYAEYLSLDERLGNYANLRVTEDEGDSSSRGRFSRYIGLATQSQAAWSWLIPALQALPDTFVDSCLKLPSFADYRIFLQKILRFKPHILSEKEEKILALQLETSQVSQETFSILTNVDLDFGSVKTAEGLKPLSQSSFISFMRNKDRGVRKRAYFKIYRTYEKHQNSIASLYAGSVKQDKFVAQVRGYPNAREMALFPDKVPEAVYDNLIHTIHANFQTLHSYYGLRKKALHLDELHHYDVYVPLAPEQNSHHSYDDAVKIVTSALAPLGEEYVSTFKKGVLGGWVDRYENKGKRSGAFSSGCYSSDPFILLNYKEDVINDVFTLAHEGGHSMHSWYSARNNPFMCYSYTIFEAEVASTFNEQLVFNYLYQNASSEAEKASLLAHHIDETLATLFRQTMFAEYEKITHAMAESGQPLTVDSLRAEYRKLLEQYFGPEMKFETLSDLEGLRIPHFYNAFYVYKYATGVSASIALSQRVLNGGEKERNDYFAFLKSGGSRFPIEALKVAGVDMSSPEPVQLACDSFAREIEQLGRSLKL